MQESLLLRGIEKSERSGRIKSLGYLVGSTIDRAFDRSISVYESMTLRGFGKNMVIKGSSFRRGDSIFLFLIIIVLFGVIFAIPSFFEVVLV